MQINVRLFNYYISLNDNEVSQNSFVRLLQMSSSSIDESTAQRVLHSSEKRIKCLWKYVNEVDAERLICELSEKLL